MADIAVWAVPFGLVGGRLYHVITDYELYFSEGRDWVDAFKIWEGGLGIWGAIALGAVGAWIGCRRRGIPLPAWADALAPGIVFAQAIGRWGNWFNQELYGKETDLPWALHITSSTDGRVPGLYHPTFLYESLWCVGVAFLVIWADRRFKLGHGRAFALYVAAYCVGRFWIEYMRVDEAHHILGMRLNNWTAIVVFLLAVVYIVLSARLRPGREEVVEPGAVPPARVTPSRDGDAVELDKKSDGRREVGDEEAAESDEVSEPAEASEARRTRPSRPRRADGFPVRRRGASHLRMRRPLRVPAPGSVGRHRRDGYAVAERRRGGGVPAPLRRPCCRDARVSSLRRASARVRWAPPPPPRR